MAAIFPAIKPAPILPPATFRYDHKALSFGSLKNLNSSRSRMWRKFEVNSQPENYFSISASIDFSDPDWKSKYQKEFEARFSIPHITDVLHDAVSYPSPFRLRMRTPVSPDIMEGYPSEWHGYIRNNDRVLLKVLSVLIQAVHGWSNGKYILPQLTLRGYEHEVL